MPGTNGGTGYPFTLRCAKCKTRRQWRYRWSYKAGLNLEATGKTGAPRNRRSLRQTTRRIQYRCLDCGHVGWTQHIDAERLLRQRGENETVSAPTPA